MYARNRITVAETASWASPIWGLDLSYRCVRYLRRWCSLRDALMSGTGFVARSWSASAPLVCTSKGSTEPARSTQTRPPRRRRHELVLGSAGRTSDRYVRPTPASVGTPPRAVPGCFVAALSSPATYQIDNSGQASPVFARGTAARECNACSSSGPIASVEQHTLGEHGVLRPVQRPGDARTPAFASPPRMTRR